jgi:hypothetical protein
MATITSFEYFNIKFDQIVPPIVFFVGVIGNIFNMIIFNRRRFRNNPCTTYFVALTITNFNNFIFGLVPDYLANAHGIHIVTSTIVICRVRFMILHCSNALSAWFTVLAGVDRFCISSRDVNRRRFSTLKNARISVCLATLICLIVYAHVLVLFAIQNTPSGLVCSPQSGVYSYSFTPPILMMFVGLATFRNIIRVRAEISPQIGTDTAVVGTGNIIQLRKRDRQYLKMLLLQLAFTIVLTLPLAVQKLYATFTQNLTKSSSRLAVESFASDAVQTFTQINSALSFFL